MNNNKYPLPFEVGYYQPSPHFLAIPEHVAVMDQDQNLIALTGPNEPGFESVEHTQLFAAAPELLDMLKEVVARMDENPPKKAKKGDLSEVFRAATYCRDREAARRLIAKIEGAAHG